MFLYAKFIVYLVMFFVEFLAINSWLRYFVWKSQGHASELQTDDGIARLGEPFCKHYAQDSSGVTPMSPLRFALEQKLF